MAFASDDTTKFYHGFPTPGPQNPSPNDVLAHIFFASEEAWKQAREITVFDYIVIGSGFCSYAFVERIIKDAKKDGTKMPKILVLERGSFFLPEHFQNLPVAFFYAQPDQKFKNETFPWTLCKAAATSDPAYGFSPDRSASWQHGMVPFFGGRSTLWSGWTPRPEERYGELAGWPKELKDMMTEQFFVDAEALVNSKHADHLNPPGLPDQFRVFNVMQRGIQTLLEGAVQAKPSKIPAMNRSMAAPLAVAEPADPLVIFEKYSVVGPYLQLLHDEAPNVVCALQCSVSEIIQQNNVPTALRTSRGIVPLSANTKIILAVGCMPAATLLLNSFPRSVIPNVGRHFSAHIVTSIIAKIPVSKYPNFGHLINPFEIGAIYLSGIDKTTGLSFHADLSLYRAIDYKKHRTQAFRYMPDVVANPSDAAMESSGGDIVFVMALLGEMDVKNPNNNFQMLNPGALDKTTNCILNYSLNKNDHILWDTMDRTGIDTIEKVFAGGDLNAVQYWIPDSNSKTGGGHWSNARDTPLEQKRARVSGLVHESCVVSAGPEAEGFSCGYDFRPYGTHNVYVTGSGLWPVGSSWNPTMTMCGFAQKLADNLHAEAKAQAAASSSGASASAAKRTQDSSSSEKDDRGAAKKSKA